MAETTHGMCPDIEALGQVITPAVARETMALLAPCFPSDFGSEIRATTDVSYGDHPGQNMDIFEPASLISRDPANRAALVFVHGGGFVGGDKQELGPFYRNVGVWAVRQGMVGFNLNHRLAPTHRWPAAADDIATALAWIAKRAMHYGIDPMRIVLMGHSAGATHAASCIAAAHLAHKPPPAAALALVSGSYILENVALTPNRAAYFGDDPTLMASRSSAEAIAQCGLPVLISTAEFDPQENLDQGRQLAQCMTIAGRRSAHIVNARQDNHFSTVLRLGAFESTFATALGEFVTALQNDARGAH